MTKGTAAMWQVTESDIAVIGMAGRFPGADSVDALWDMLVAGREGISFFTEEELLAEGIPAEVIGRDRYVRAKGMLAGTDLFDAGFFGCSPRDAAAMDPQQRLFLECAWHALEDAGVDPESTAHAIGVFAGSSASTYLTRSLRELGDRPDFMELILGNDKDHLPTRTAYKLNLTGPAVCVQTACSTSLVAVHLAGQALLAGECGIALAGGVSVMFPQREGYTYSDEGINSHDGHCRAFDAAATGTVPGDGLGIVVLKLLTDALADGDTVLAVIKGTAINNDGAAKVGFTAPSIAGQSAVILAAHRAAGTEPDTIGYVEAHGTGTALGDPAELAALTRAFRSGTDRVGFCAVGSVKSNIGHLDAAAGIAGLIKAILVVRKGLIPPSAHVERPNPAMSIESSPFTISTATTGWQSAAPRRAGVSSFGVGGTNAHVVLQQAAPVPAAEPARGPSLVLLSATTAGALQKMTDNLADHLTGNPGLDLADVAYTTQVGRKAFAHRRFLVCPQGLDSAEAARRLAGARRPARRRPDTPPRVLFMFPGQGAQHARMGADLYRQEPAFRAELDRCAELLGPLLGADLRDLLYPDGPRAADLEDTALAQPALFAVEYALACLWRQRGVEPAAMIGHSVGEYVAACLSGVFSLPDALTLVAHRGRLMGQAEPGAMLSVGVAEERLPALPGDVGIAAVNGPELCVVSGPEPEIAALQARLRDDGVRVRRLHTSHAFHSTMMSTAAKRLSDLAAELSAQPPRIPFVSNVTGGWLTAEQATDPGYWARHALSPVRFADGLATLDPGEDSVLLELGPGHTLSTLATGQVGGDVVPSLRHPNSTACDLLVQAEAAGRLWSAGVPVDWRRWHTAPRRRVPLPVYPFQRRSHRLDQPAPAAPPDELTTCVGEPTGHVVYGSDTERTVAALWAELLGTPGPAPDDDFFLLGGHSLLGTRLTTRLQETFGVALGLRDLFRTPTVAGQAQLIDALHLVGTGPRERTAAFEEGEL